LAVNRAYLSTVELVDVPQTMAVTKSVELGELRNVDPIIVDCLEVP